MSKIKSITLPKISKIKDQTIHVPASKSITNRVFILGTCSDKVVTLSNILESEDTQVMQDALKTMGADIISIKNNDIKISKGRFFNNPKEYLIDCKNSGTSIRFLTALSILRKGNTILTGVERMKERPIKDLVDALLQLGVQIKYLEKEGFPPLKIFGNTNIKESKISIKGDISSQFITAILQIAPLLAHGLTINLSSHLVSKPYIDMSIQMLKSFGIKIQNENYKSFYIPHQIYKSPKKYFIETDASSASYPLAIAALTKSKIEIPYLPQNSIQGDSLFSEIVLKKMGAKVEQTKDSIIVTGEKKLEALGEINLEDIPDVAMTAVTLCAATDGYSHIKGLSTLRHKECDRIDALCNNLKNMGVKVKNNSDSIEIWGNPKLLHAASIDTYNDHRVAMSFTILSCIIKGIEIQNPQCVEKTYPLFWEMYQKLIK